MNSSDDTIRDPSFTAYVDCFGDDEVDGLALEKSADWDPFGDANGGYAPPYAAESMPNVFCPKPSEVNQLNFIAVTVNGRQNSVDLLNFYPQG